MTNWLTERIPPISTGGYTCPICGLFMAQGVTHFCGGAGSIGNIPLTPIAQMGWLCPRCLAMNAPWVSKCACLPRTPEETSADAET